MSLSPNQSVYPLGLYHGPTFRLNYEFHHVRKSNSYPFYGIDLYYKYLYFDNIALVNEVSDSDNFFTQSEKSNVIGFHVNAGHMYNFKLIFLSYSFWIGATCKYRNYTITNSWGGDFPNPELDGNYSTVQKYCSAIMSIIIGFKI